jgi:hypothetical protein
LPILAYGQNVDTLKKQSFLPVISGLIKTKWEYCFDDHTNRFDIRNSRLAIGGALSSFIDYKLQIEYSNHGIFTFLDAYAMIKPWDNFTFWFGQFTIPFSEDYVISPTQNIFVNRTFVGKFINPSTRDIGIRADYSISTKMPLSVQVGIYNGTGINNPEWQESPFLLGRLIYGTMEGFRASIKYYGGKNTETGKKIAHYGFDLRYVKNRYKVEAEYVLKDSLYSDIKLSGTYIQGAYSFPVNNKRLLKYIEPALRGDAMGYDVFNGGFDISRMTIGVNFGLDKKPMAVELRLNYEHFFMRKSESDIWDNSYYNIFFERSDKGMFDKISVELMIKF